MTFPIWKTLFLQSFLCKCNIICKMYYKVHILCCKNVSGSCKFLLHSHAKIDHYKYANMEFVDASNRIFHCHSVPVHCSENSWSLSNLKQEDKKCIKGTFSNVFYIQSLHRLYPVNVSVHLHIPSPELFNRFVWNFGVELVYWK